MTASSQNQARRRVYVAYTGGTIGMQRSASGYVPSPGFLASELERSPELAHPSMPEYELQGYEPLLDSANMTPAHWLAIAQDIERRYDDFDGFVVLHGTDTLAYTASALAFMLQGLSKPVVLTGSQIPLAELRNDARTNLITALQVAGGYDIPEVCLVFGNRLMRGCRTTKVNAEGLDAFASPRFPDLGDIGTRIKIHWERVRKPHDSIDGLEIRSLAGPTVGALRLFPGLNARFLENALQAPLEGLVLECYGIGNGHEHDQAFLKALRAATDRGVVVVGTTQCLKGAVDLSGYATGQALADAGVISGLDMTAEAALAKLHYLFSTGLAPERVREEMQRNLRGELTASRG